MRDCRGSGEWRHRLVQLRRDDRLIIGLIEGANFSLADSAVMSSVHLPMACFVTISGVAAPNSETQTYASGFLLNATARNNGCDCTPACWVWLAPNARPSLFWSDVWRWQ